MSTFLHQPTASSALQTTLSTTLHKPRSARTPRTSFTMTQNPTRTLLAKRPLRTPPTPPTSASYSDRRTSTLPLAVPPTEKPTRAAAPPVTDFDSSKVASPFLDESVLERRRRDAAAAAAVGEPGGTVKTMGGVQAGGRSDNTARTSTRR